MAPASFDFLSFFAALTGWQIASVFLLGLVSSYGVALLFERIVSRGVGR